MNEEKDLGYYKNLKYDVVLKKKGDFFVLFIPELACVTEDESLEKAYEKLELEKEKIFKKLIELNAQDIIREPVRAKSIKKERFTNTLVSNLLPFFVKLLIILLVGGIFLKVASNKIASLDQSKIITKINQISRSIYNIDQITTKKLEEIRSKNNDSN